MDRVISFRCELVYIDGKHLLGAGTDAELTSFTIQVVDFNPSFDGHLKAS